MKRDLLIDRLEEYSSSMIPLHMPGHKRRVNLSNNFRYLRRLGADLDITEVTGFDDLHEPEGILKASMERAALFWGSDESRYLVNGSTCGILAGIYALTNHGDRVIVARNCHKSVYHAIELRNLEPVFLLPQKDEETGILGSIDPGEIDVALQNHPDAKLIIVSSPTYEGVISDIESICKIAHRRDIPVLVDEAHGSHLGHFGIFPKNAVQCGADLVIQSLHKTLPSLTQTAILHTRGTRVDRCLLKRAIGIFETSSPSYLLLSSIDSCIALLEQEGEDMLQHWYERLSDFDNRARALNHLRLFCRGETKSSVVFDYDRSKIVICTDRIGQSGGKLASLLRENHAIETEFSSLNYCIAMTGAGDRAGDVDCLATALMEIDKEYEGATTICPETHMYLLPSREYPVSTAMSLANETVNFDQAVGRVCAEYLWAYPPGIPLVVPGEVITRELVDLFFDYREAGIVLRSTTYHLEDEISVLR